METFDPETFEKKFQIADAATKLYVEGDGEFLIKDVAEEVDLDPAEIFDYFPNKDSILQFYYASLIIRYEMMIDEIDDFESYTLSEKFSNFAYASFDMLEEKEMFVQATLPKLLHPYFTKTDFEKEAERLVKKFLEDDPRLSIASTIVQNSYFYGFIRYQYLELVGFWLKDDSEDHELTMELTDKLTGLMQELMYNAVIDKGFDFIKFVYANKKEFFCKIPIVKQFCSKIEIR
jgi:AcrR family transcriptional regulator